MIEIERKAKATTFGDIEVGTLFFGVYYKGPDYETIWLKTATVTKVADETYEEFNATIVVGDDAGTMHHFADDEKLVIPIYNAKLVIES